MSLFVAAPDFMQAVSDAVVAARLEVAAFGIAMLMYALLVSKRVPKAQPVGKKVFQKDTEDPSSPKSLAESTKKVRKPVAKKGVDVAKQIVMIRKCASEKNLKGALTLFDSLKESGAELNSIVYNTMIDACVTCQDLKAAHSWMEEARRAGMIDVVSFNTIMKAHLQNKDFEKARSIIREMKESGLQPNPVTFNELTNAVVKAGGKKDTVWAVVEEMKDVGLAPNQVTCSILLKDLTARSSDKEIQKTMNLLDSLKEPMDEILISSTVEALVRIGKPELLAEKLSKLQDGNRLVIKSSHTFGSLIKAHGSARDLQGVWRQWKALRTHLVKPTSITVGCMVEALVTNCCTEDAFELVQQLQADADCSDTVNSVIYCSILKGFAREKKLERVWDVYQEFEQRKLEMSLVTFNTVMDACARVGRMQYAAKIMQDMKKHDVEPNIITYSTMLKGHCQAGDIELAFSVLRQMKQQAGLKPDEIMYNSLIDGCAQHSLYAEGMQVYDEMMQDGVRPSNFTLSILVKLLNRSRKVDQAFTLVQEISQKYRIKPNAHVYTNLIQACVSNRRHERAVSVLETMVKERVQPDMKTYGVLIRASIYHSNFQQAAGLLRTALGLNGALDTLADVRFAACSVDSHFVNDALGQLAGRGCLQSHVAPLLADLKKSKHRIHIDPALQRKVTECFR